MIKEKFDYLIESVKAHLTTNPATDLDLVKVWQWIDEVDVMNFINPKDFFRGMCLWLNANAKETEMLTYISGYAVDSKAFYDETIAGFDELKTASSGEIMLSMLISYRDALFPDNSATTI